MKLLTLSALFLSISCLIGMENSNSSVAAISSKYGIPVHNQQECAEIKGIFNDFTKLKSAGEAESFLKKIRYKNNNLLEELGIYYPDAQDLYRKKYNCSEHLDCLPLSERDELTKNTINEMALSKYLEGRRKNYLELASARKSLEDLIFGDLSTHQPESEGSSQTNEEFLALYKYQ
jgi:hypothetical protein